MARCPYALLQTPCSGLGSRGCCTEAPPRETDSTGRAGGAAQEFPAQPGRWAQCLKVTFSNILKGKGRQITSHCLSALGSVPALEELTAP